jgi:hypothetical protein
MLRTNTTEVGPVEVPILNGKFLVYPGSDHAYTSDKANETYRAKYMEALTCPRASPSRGRRD